eukprot:TRINITY_DN10193_c0_g2_i2.p1 TRINITY_DN10193_c0_g2~~TRINITY_DN10193_c0_g2_i2.p1  ORF type:complete len:189 (+),score=20.18 TRINITY_DN10193_c0_g2_i2:61-627(+)
MSEPPPSSRLLWQGAKKLFQPAHGEMELRAKKLPLEWHLSRLLIAIAPAAIFVLCMESIKGKLKTKTVSKMSPTAEDEANSRTETAASQQNEAYTSTEPAFGALAELDARLKALEQAFDAKMQNHDLATDPAQESLQSSQQEGTVKDETEGGHSTGPRTTTSPWRYDPNRTWTSWMTAMLEPPQVHRK